MPTVRPDDESLYPGQNTTGLVAEDRFRWRAHLDRRRRTPARSEARREAFQRPIMPRWPPSSTGVRATVTAWQSSTTGHSIRSHIPFLFEGVLPDFNIGTANGTTCDPPDRACGARDLRTSRGLQLRPQWPLSRAAGPRVAMVAPPMDCTAIQMELAQSSHLESEAPPFA